MVRPRGYEYYNAPDGQRPIEKVVATSKYGFTLGLLAGVNESVMSTAPKSPLLIWNCIAYYVVPVTTMCATFSAVTYAATKIRGVDGPANHALGAMAAALIMYKWKKNPIVALNYGLLGAIIAASLKHAKQIHFDVLPLYPKRTQNYGLYAGHDYTWAKDPRPWKNQNC